LSNNLSPCKKVGFSSKQEAKKEAKLIDINNKHLKRKKNKKKNMKIRVYECPICLRWHLTVLKPEKFRKKSNKNRLNNSHKLSGRADRGV
jgi:hypothetical protein